MFFFDAHEPENSEKFDLHITTALFDIMRPLILLGLLALASALPVTPGHADSALAMTDDFGA